MKTLILDGNHNPTDYAKKTPSTRNMRKKQTIPPPQNYRKTQQHHIAKNKL